MKILIADTYYPAFLKSFYKQNLKNLNYAQQYNALTNACFGTSDFYSYHLNKLGWEANDLIVNCIELQKQWSMENRFHLSSLSLNISPKFYRIPLVGSFLSNLPGLAEIAIQQIKTYKPDVLYCQDLSFFRPETLRYLKSFVKLIVGQIACPLPPASFLREYDLILTSFPHFVEKFVSLGIKSEFFRIGFDDRILNLLGKVEKDIDFSFVGGISKNHSAGNRLLHLLSEESDIVFFGYGANTLDSSSPIIPRHHGEAWGLDMYNALARSKITLNRHINISEDYANNMRLYEATGVGAMLLTDKKRNLQDLFDIGTEVVAYSSSEEALELALYYQQHPNKAQDIAKAGQKRTLGYHTYSIRMNELSSILQRHLSLR